MGVDLARAPWRTVKASVAGTSHSAHGQPCADASAVRVLGRGRGSLLVAVASDGAGSAERAREGARLACASIVGQAEAWARCGRGRRRRPVSSFAPADAVAWIQAAQRTIDDAAGAEGRERREFSCTLLVAFVDGASAAFFQIGDGAIVYRGADGGYVPALWPQSGEYANCTFFVTDESAADRVQAAWAEGVHEVALLTDGLQALALHFDRREAHAPFFEPMFARLRRDRGTRAERLDRELRAFLDSPAVNQRTDDDKTLVLLTRLRPDGGVRAAGDEGG